MYLSSCSHKVVHPVDWVPVIHVFEFMFIQGGASWGLGSTYPCVRVRVHTRWCILWTGFQLSMCLSLCSHKVVHPVDRVPVIHVSEFVFTQGGASCGLGSSYPCV